MARPKKHEIFSSSESEDSQAVPQYVSLKLTLNGEAKDGESYNLFAIFDGQIVLDGKWEDQLNLHSPKLPLNLNDPQSASLAADNPIILVLRQVTSAKASKETLLVNQNNRAGGTIDLIPLILGEPDIFEKVTLIDVNSGENTGFTVNVHAQAIGPGCHTRIPLTITMIRAHCLPFAKEDTGYICAIGLDGLVDPVPVNFGMSQNPPEIHYAKTNWASLSAFNYVARSEIFIPDEDIFVPEGLEIDPQVDCPFASWNVMKRVVVDPRDLRERIKKPFFLDLAGIARPPKTDVIRSRYIAFIDARVLLEPGQFGVTTSAKLLLFNEEELPSTGMLLDIPPPSSKSKSPSSSKPKSGSVNQSKFTTDGYGHTPYVVLRFDITEPLMPIIKTTALHEIINVPTPEVITKLQEELYVKPPPEDDTIDARRIRKECGALAVHKELSGLACRGQVPMNQSIKRTAANRLMMRVRGMLKQFPPDGNTSSVDWQDTVTGQHAASRRAVTASFEPQPPPTRLTSRYAEAQTAGNKQLWEKLFEIDFKVAPSHPKPLLTKALRYLELREDSEGRNYLLKALNQQPRNRYILWAYGAQEYSNGKEHLQKAVAALRIAATGEYSDGCSNVIGWAALHAINHYDENVYYSFVAIKRMRKYFELPIYWKDFLKRWEDASGSKEVLWRPSSVAVDDPFLIAAAFFLCLRGYALSELLLHCYENRCSTHGSRLARKFKFGPDVYYLRAASLLLRRNYDKALELIEAGTKRLGPCAILSQLRSSCLIAAKGWDGEFETAFAEAENLDTEWSQAILLQSALGGMSTNPEAALQRAARAHKISPSAYSALTIGRIYLKLEKTDLAERWIAAAVKLEPLLGDGWALLALIALHNRYIDKARALLRTAKQVGEISKDIHEEVNRAMKVAHAWGLPEILVNEVCFCDYY